MASRVWVWSRAFLKSVEKTHSSAAEIGTAFANCKETISAFYKWRDSNLNQIVKDMPRGGKRISGPGKKLGRKTAPSIRKTYRWRPRDYELIKAALALSGKNEAEFVKETALERAEKLVSGVPETKQVQHSPPPQDKSKTDNYYERARVAIDKIEDRTRRRDWETGVATPGHKSIEGVYLKFERGHGYTWHARRHSTEENRRRYDSLTIFPIKKKGRKSVVFFFDSIVEAKRDFARRFIRRSSFIEKEKTLR